jgi:serine/threonine protein kinase
MSSKLLSKGGFGCIFYPGITCKGNIKNDKKYVTKLQRKDFNANNEVVIGDMIKQIDNYKKYFLPVVKSCPVNIRKMNNPELKKCDIISSSKNFNYVVMDIPYIKSIEFTDLLTDPNKTHEERVVFILETYKQLLKAIELLNNAGVVHFDLKIENILFDKITHTPYIIDFGISVPIKKITQENIREYFYIFAPEYYVWCLDIVVINYLLHETSEPLSEKSVKYIVDLYVEYNKGLSIYSDNFKYLYRDACIKQLTKFVGVDKNRVIQYYFNYYKTWDNYSLSIIYLKILSILLSNKVIPNSYIVSLAELLTMNISPNPDKRFSIKQTREKFINVILKTDDINEYKNFVKAFNFSDSHTIKQFEKESIYLKDTMNKYKHSDVVVV